MRILITGTVGCYLNHFRFGQNDTRSRNDKRHESSVVRQQR